MTNLNIQNVPKVLADALMNLKEIQKFAIIQGLIPFSGSELYSKKDEILDYVSKLLGYENGREAFKMSKSIDYQQVLTSLTYLDSNLKDWYVVIVYFYLQADGPVPKFEFQKMLSFFGSIGVSSNRFEQILRNLGSFK